MIALVATVLGSAHPAQAELDPIEDPPSGPIDAFIVVDADTGAVISAGNEHEVVKPASTIKLFTAAMAMSLLPEGDDIPVSAVAEAMPARRLGMAEGEVWRLENVVHNMMLVSANDSAVAAAERVGGGDLDGWTRVAQRAALRMGMTDGPQLFDPSGLDDEQSFRGGPSISAWDLAIAARYAFEVPGMAEITGTRYYEYDGGDGSPHDLTNKNLLLDLYEYAIGGKTGFTERAGRTFVGVAERDGRRMIAVALGADDTYGTAEALLTRAFNVPVDAQEGLPHLPPLVEDPYTEPPSAAAEVGLAGIAIAKADASPAERVASTPWWVRALVAIVVLSAGFVVMARLRVRAMVAHRPVRAGRQTR